MRRDVKLWQLTIGRTRRVGYSLVLQVDGRLDHAGCGLDRRVGLRTST